MKRKKMYEIAIFSGNDNDFIKTYEHETKEETFNMLNDLLMNYINYVKIEISIITKEVYNNTFEDNIESELLFTIINEKENKGAKK